MILGYHLPDFSPDWALRCLSHTAFAMLLGLMSTTAGAEPTAKPTALWFKALNEGDINALPRSVAPEFRDIARYRKEFRSGDLGFAAPGNNCVSLALNAWQKTALSGGPSLNTDDYWLYRASPQQQCATFFELLLSNPDLHASLAPHNNTCHREDEYLIVPLIGEPNVLSIPTHLVRQLPDGRFIQIPGPDDPPAFHAVIQWLMIGDRHATKVDDLQQLITPPSMYRKLCHPICVSTGHSVASQPPVTAPTLPKRVPPKPSPGSDEKSLAGTWTAVSPDPSAKPVPYANGFRCGPFNVRVFMLVGVPPGWVNKIIPGATSGPRAVQLQVISEIDSMIRDRKEARDQFGYMAVDLMFASTLGSGGSDDIAFKEFYTPPRTPEKDLRTGAVVHLPPIVDPVRGFRFTIVSVERNVMRVQTDWESPCLKTLTFHRSSLWGGSPEVVR